MISPNAFEEDLKEEWSGMESKFMELEEEWCESSPQLNKSQIRPTHQSEQICKKPFQC